MPQKRILVVDDEPMVLESVKMILSQAGHQLETASDALEALRKTEAAEFDLVLTDLKMPGMRGDELARQIQARKPEQRIILLTAYPPETLPSCFQRILIKPFSVAELRKAVDELG